MKTKALRLYGAKDLRTEEFELPEITDDEILAEVISDSICMSTYKCAMLGETDPRFARLDEICKANNGLWCKAAEDYVLANWKAE